MAFTRLSFAHHRIFWSRAAAILAIAYIVLVPPPVGLGRMVLETGEVIGFFLLATAVLGRLWCLAFIAGAKNETLITVGPYSIVRNPLYVLNLLGAVGLGLAVENPPLALLLGCGFALFYPGVVREEEARLGRLFGADYAAYRAATPRWFPKWSAYREPESWVISPRRFRKGLLGAMWFLWVFMIWEIVEEFELLASLQQWL
jgi:protein-S-isoprenylcysteine O-methyltransferase Ste14